MAALPTTEEEIDGFLDAFESCTLPKSEWTHAAHIFTGRSDLRRIFGMTPDLLQDLRQHDHQFDLALQDPARNIRDQ